MALGKKCPHCGNQTFHNQGSVHICSSCNYIGWQWRQSVVAMGKGKGGKGNKCPNCGNQTLHAVVSLPDDSKLRRCGTCDFSGIEPSINP